MEIKKIKEQSQNKDDDNGDKIVWEVQKVQI